MVLTRMMWVVAAPVLAAALAACGGGGGGGPDKPTVVATTGFAADIVRGVAGGDAEVLQLVPDSSNPHSYGASAKDRRRLAEADLIVEFGRGYEEGLPLSDVDAPRFAFTDHVRAVRDDGRDPHVWMDPTRIARTLPGLAAALAREAPDRAEAFRARAEKEAVALRRVDADLRRILRGIPPPRRKLVTSHDSLGYFAARYDLAFVAAPFGRSPEAEASAEDVADVVAAVRRERVPAVFAQEGDDPKVMRQIAREAGVEVVDDLLVESPGPKADSYVEALRHDARRIAEALGE